MCDISQITSFTETSGRLSITAHVLPIGRDLQILLLGGDAHLGAIALANAAYLGCLEIPGHREREICAGMAMEVAARLGNQVAVSAGIHFEKITAREIAEVEKLSEILTDRIGRFFQSTI